MRKNIYIYGSIFLLLLIGAYVFSIYYKKHQEPSTDEYCYHEDISANLNSYPGSTLKLNIGGELKSEKGVQAFNFKKENLSSLNLALPISGESKGKIEFTVDFELAESFAFSRAKHKGTVGIFLNYTVQSYGEIELSIEEPYTQKLIKNNSYSKVSKIAVVSNSDNNEIYIVVGLTKASSPSGGKVGVSSQFNKASAKEKAFSFSKENLVTRQLVFTLKLELEKPNLEDPEIKNTKKLEFSNDSAFVRSEELATIVDWWNNLTPATQDKISDKKAKIIITGYASPPNAKIYKLKLGNERASNVEKHLAQIIGAASSNNNSEQKTAVIITETRGECAEDPERYVMIRIEDNK